MNCSTFLFLCGNFGNAYQVSQGDTLFCEYASIETAADSTWYLLQHCNLTHTQTLRMGPQPILCVAGKHTHTHTHAMVSVNSTVHFLVTHSLRQTHTQTLRVNSTVHFLVTHSLRQTHTQTLRLNRT